MPFPMKPIMKRLHAIALLLLVGCHAQSASTAPSSEPAPGGEDTSAQAPTDDAPPVQGTPACVRGGCSGELCLPEGEERMSPCVMRPEFACYREATCERQDDGQCGFTPTASLASCLANPPSM